MLRGSDANKVILVNPSCTEQLTMKYGCGEKYFSYGKIA